MKTTLLKIRKCFPPQPLWEKLLKHLSKTGPDDDQLSLLIVLESNGLDDTLWCLRAVDGYDREKRLYGVWCARQAIHLKSNQISLDCLDIAQRFAEGNATQDELDVARDAAFDAAWASAMSIYSTKSAVWAASKVDAMTNRSIQEKELIRMINCIETGVKYEI